MMMKKRMMVMKIIVSIFAAYIPGWMNDNEEKENDGDGDEDIDDDDGDDDIDDDGDGDDDDDDDDDDYNFHVSCLYPPKDPPSVGWMRSQGRGLGGVRESHQSKYPHILWNKEPHIYCGDSIHIILK